MENKRSYLVKHVFQRIGPLFHREGPRVSPDGTFSKTQGSYPHETPCILSRVAYEQCPGTSHECLQLVLEKAPERVVVGRKTVAYVVSCDNVKCFPMTSSLHFLQSSETAHPIDDGSTVTCLVHRHAAESQRVGCRLEQVCWCKEIDISDGYHQISHTFAGARAC